jgi:soluble lytic murein transglycosylase-like protein
MIVRSFLGLAAALFLHGAALAASELGPFNPPRSWSPEQGFRVPVVGTVQPMHYDQYRQDAAQFARDKLGFFEQEAARWAEQRTQELKAQKAAEAQQQRNTATDSQVAQDAAENKMKRSEVATGRQDPGVGVRVRDTVQNDQKAEIARNAAERSGAASKISKATAGTLNSVNPNAGEPAQNVCDVSSAGTPQKNTKITNAQKKAIANKIIAKAREMGVDPALALSVAYHEGSLNPNARGADGEIGTFQLMAGTAAGLGVTDRSNLDQNIWGGIKYLKQQLTRFGDVRQALAAYNGGPGIVRRDGSYSNRQYPEYVLAHYDSFKRQIANGELGNGQGDETVLSGLVQQASTGSNNGGCDKRLKDAMDENTRARSNFGAIDNQRAQSQNQLLNALVQRQLRELALQSQMARSSSTGDQVNWNTVQETDPVAAPCPKDIAQRGNVTCFKLAYTVSQSRLMAWLQTLQDLARASQSTAQVNMQIFDGQAYAIVITSPNARAPLSTTPETFAMTPTAPVDAAPSATRSTPV